MWGGGRGVLSRTETDKHVEGGSDFIKMGEIVTAFRGNGRLPTCFEQNTAEREYTKRGGGGG